VENAYGSELLPLSMIYRVEYYDLITPTSPTSGFKVNDEDNSTVSGCTGTLMNTAAVALSDFQLNLSVGETAVGSVSGLSNGLGSLVLSAPGAGNQGMVRVNAAVPSWLEYDFDGDGAADQPGGIASFGVSAGDELLFFQRESYR
jgi:MSHA biogenesis protein MshQ